MAVEHMKILGLECDELPEPGFIADFPNDVIFPFFVMDFDPYTHKSCQCSSSRICHIARLRAGTVCAAALNLIDRLAEIAANEDEAEDTRVRAPIPPMVTATFYKQHVRVWIAYRVKLNHGAEPEDDGEQHAQSVDEMLRVQCIWKGDMTAQQDAARLKAIMGNVSTWARSQFRNRISDYIAAWKRRFPLSDEDEDESGDIELITTKFSSLKLSRTDSMRSDRLLEAKPRQEILNLLPSSADELRSVQDQRAGDISGGTNDSARPSVITPSLGNSPKDANEVIVFKDEDVVTTDSNVQITRDQAESVYTSPAHDIRPERHQIGQDHLILPPIPRPRGNSTGSNILRDSNPASFRLSPEPPNPMTPKQGGTLMVGKTRADRPRSFDATAFMGVAFPFNASSTQTKDDSSLTTPKKNIRIFSAHDLDGEKFTFSVSPGDAR